MLGAGSFAYVVGKLTYIFGENCSKKFLELVSSWHQCYEVIRFLLLQAPNSEITAKLRENQEYQDDKSLPNVESRNLGFADVLDDLDFSNISEVEKTIMEDCNSTAFWRYSLPLSLFSSGTIYASIKAGWLNPSKRNSTFPSLPKMLVGGVLGYIAGQWLYVYSRDCTNRFLSFAPDGEIAMRLRGESVILPSNTNTNLTEYMLPSDRCEEIESIIKKQCGF